MRAGSIRRTTAVSSHAPVTMSAPPSDEQPLPGSAPALSDPAGRQAAMIRRMPEPRFGVLDGGHFDNLPGLLAAAGLAARSLFLGQGERDAERHGPWLLPLLDDGHTDAVLALVGEHPAAVFWSCAPGEVALYDHLRRLNMARLPRWAAMGKPGPEPGVEADRGWELVLFRHWDPRVLGSLLPVLDEVQFSRILGPAAEISFFAAEHGGGKRVLADPDWPIAPSGPLTIRPDQVMALDERRLEARRARITAYLKDVAPNEAATYTDAELRALVLASEGTGHGMNLSSDQGHARWAYLMLRTRGQVPQQPGLRDYVLDGRASPDDKMTLLLHAVAAAEAAGGQGAPVPL